MDMGCVCVCVCVLHINPREILHLKCQHVERIQFGWGRGWGCVPTQINPVCGFLVPVTFKKGVGVNQRFCHRSAVMLHHLPASNTLPSASNREGAVTSNRSAVGFFLNDGGNDELQRQHF